MSLITLKLDQLAHLGISDNIAIASAFLLGSLQEFLGFEFLREALDVGYFSTFPNLSDLNM
jgi:hypothetical protein